MMFITKDYFKINGVSSNNFDVLVNTPPVPPMAEKRYSTYNVGSDEDTVINDEDFSDVSYSIEFFTIDRVSYNNDDIYSFISNAKTFEISRLPGYYFKVKKISLSAPVSSFNGAKVKYTLNLTLSPFKYSLDNEEIIVNSGDVIVNNGTIFSKPVIEITGSSETDYSFNGVVFKLWFPTNGKTVIVDSGRKIVYEKNTNQILYNFSGGKFPLLAPGQNKIIFGKPSIMKLKKNERWY